MLSKVVLYKTLFTANIQLSSTLIAVVCNSDMSKLVAEAVENWFKVLTREFIVKTAVN